MLLSLGEIRKVIIQRIVIARKEYFRLKDEITTLNPVLPLGTYLSTYTSNSKRQRKYTYYRLSNKKFKNQYHLGRSHNPRFLQGALDIEKSRILQIKLETLERVKSHIEGLKIELKDCKDGIYKFGIHQESYFNDIEGYLEYSDELFKKTFVLEIL